LFGIFDDVKFGGSRDMDVAKSMVVVAKNEPGHSDFLGGGARTVLVLKRSNSKFSEPSICVLEAGRQFSFANKFRIHINDIDRQAEKDRRQEIG
jgi:hypothetical protein